MNKSILEISLNMLGCQLHLRSSNFQAISYKDQCNSALRGFM
jgi:hypothetical protein